MAQSVGVKPVSFLKTTEIFLMIMDRAKKHQGKGVPFKTISRHKVIASSYRWHSALNVHGIRENGTIAKNISIEA